MKKPKYKTYLELAAAFKSGELPKGYYMMMDKGGAEASLNFYDKSLSDEELEEKQDACMDLFNPPQSDAIVEDLFNEMGIPCQWC